MENEEKYFASMKVKTLFLSILLSGISSMYAHDIQIGQLFYNLDTINHTAQVTFKGDFYYQHDEYQGDIVIPTHFIHNNEKYWITSIRPNAFANCRSLNSITIPPTIRMIGRETFKNCNGLQTISLPNTLEVIQYEAFAHCSQLSSIKFSTALTTICDRAFAHCKKLNEVYTLAKNISDCAFDMDCVVHRSEAPVVHQESKEYTTVSSITSDVDINIPQVDIKNRTTLVVIFANENYEELTSVPYAIRDGEIFYKYCISTLGIPAEHIRLVKDATLNNMHKQINWLSDAVTTFNGNANIILYYAGHGIPDEVTRKAYLLPTDGYGDDTRSAFALDDMYAQLGQTSAKRIIVLLDACFSGSTRNEEILVPTRAAILKAKEGLPQGNMIVFSATTNDQTAYPINNEGHGMFTYYLLKKLQDSKGNASMEEIVDYVRSNVNQRSVLINSKSQTPTINVSPAIENNWKKWMLK